MTEAILVAVRVISIVVIAIILIVLANTMAMTARERWSEIRGIQDFGISSEVYFYLDCRRIGRDLHDWGDHRSDSEFSWRQDFSKTIGKLSPSV